MTVGITRRNVEGVQFQVSFGLPQPVWRPVWHTLPSIAGPQAPSFAACCTRYPECNFTAWNRPVPTKCPACGNPYMKEKYLKGGAVLQCLNPECQHKEAAVEKAS